MLTPENWAQIAPGEEGDPVTPPAHPGWSPPALGRPIHPQPESIEDGIVTECADLDQTVSRALQHESICSITPFGEDVDLDPHLLRATRALAVIARSRIRSGRVREGVELLLDAVRLADDVMRGRPSLVGAMVAVAMRDIVVGQLQGIMASPLSWQGGELEELERQSLVIARTQNSFVGWIGDDGLTMARDALSRRGWSVPVEIEQEMRDAMVMGDGDRRVEDLVLAGQSFAYAHTRTLCEGTMTRADCMDAWRSELSRAQRDAVGVSPILGDLSPSIDREGALRITYASSLGWSLRYLERAAQSEATIRAVPLLFVHRRLSLAGTCPDPSTLEATQTFTQIAEGFGGAFTVLPTNLEYRPLEVSAPSGSTPALRSQEPCASPCSISTVRRSRSRTRPRA